MKSSTDDNDHAKYDSKEELNLDIPRKLENNFMLVDAQFQTSVNTQITNPGRLLEFLFQSSLTKKKKS